ncbi:MAG TPA: hypothetical protein PLD91_17755 [Spirochaetota bacterium]|nr:hypothetical protein [Spirochaetota bacterium]
MAASVNSSIAQAIIEFFSKGVTAGKDIVLFAESTLGIGNAAELANLLSEPDSYGEGLVDLVFSPENALRKTIEPHIPFQGLSPSDMDAVAAMVAYNLAMINVIFEGTGITCAVTMNQLLVTEFTRKLNLSISLPFHSRNDFPEYLSDEAVIALRVLVRNSRYRSAAEHDRVIISLLKGLGRPTGGDDMSLIADCLSLLLELFNGSQAACEGYAMLSAEKIRCEDILQKASQFGEYIARYSMEFLMANKVQPPAADIEDIRRKIYLLDLISTSVYGRRAGGSANVLTLPFDGNSELFP